MTQPDSTATTPPTLDLAGCPEYNAWLYAGFFRDNALLHPELPYSSRGRHAVALPYSLWRDDWVTGILLLCLMLLVYALNKTRQQLRQRARDFFFRSRPDAGLSAVETSVESTSRLFMTLLLCLLGSVITFAYSQHMQGGFLGHLSPRWLLGIYVASFLFFFILRRGLSLFVNWIFFPKSQQKTWNDNYSFLISVESIAFFPLALIFVYFHLPLEKTAFIFLFILLIIKILLAFKAYHIFFGKSYGLFHLFVYLCALELMPLLALWKSLAIVTENLVVKY